MAKVIAFAQTQIPDERVAVLRHLLVYTCALSLIFAGRALPF
ncbi:hypothetical protein [Qipengyuania oceanensis]|nr:hypothetical protein [Qipengyuania oceanensis]